MIKDIVTRPDTLGLIQPGATGTHDVPPVIVSVTPNTIASVLLLNACMQQPSPTGSSDMAQPLGI